MSDLIQLKPRWTPNDSQPYQWSIAPPPSSTLKTLSSTVAQDEDATQDESEGEGQEGKKQKLDEEDGKFEREEEEFNPLLFRALQGVGRGLEREERERMKLEDKGGDGE